MTDSIPQEGRITPLNAEVLGNENSFRAALAKAESRSEPEDTPAPEEIPQDVKLATRESETTEDSSGVDDTNVANTDESSGDSGELEGDEPEAETKGHLIPQSRFNQEIEKRKALEGQLVKEREERIRYETQLEMLTNMHQQAQQAPTPPLQPSIDEIDPLDTDTYNYAKREIEALKMQLQNVTYETQQRTQEMQYHNIVTAQEAAFSKENPDFKDAMKHVQDVEFNIAKDLLGDDRAANEYVGAKLRDVLTRSLNSGKNAADTIYKMAKNYGYSTVKAQSKAPASKDIGAIAKNMERSANTGNLGNSGNFGAIPTDIAAAMNKSGNPLSGVNPESFHKMLDRLR